MERKRQMPRIRAKASETRTTLLEAAKTMLRRDGYAGLSTRGSRFNHTYARKPVGAHPDFYALWADGSPLEPTPSSLYFATKEGRVFRLPTIMTGATAKPEPVP